MKKPNPDIHSKQELNLQTGHILKPAVDNDGTR